MNVMYDTEIRFTSFWLSQL